MSDLPPAVLPTLKDRFGFDALRPGQGEVVTALLEGRSALAVFPTGGGKSMCYQLPALLLDGITLVVSPLIALMKDQIDVLQARGIAAARLDSSLDGETYRKVWQDLEAGELKLLYVAPERFGNERFLSRLKRVRIALMAIDEAHCISEWGHNFRPDYLKLARQARDLEVERVVALTATATPPVVEQIGEAFGIAESDRVVTGFHRPNLFLWATPVAAGQRDALLMERLTSRPSGPTVVYVTLQRTAERLADCLHDAGMPAEAYHAGMKPEQRSDVQDRFMASEHGIVVATIAFGMGIDKADIRHVLHYNLPKALENYAQEIGRAGRDGEPSTCELFACPDDVVTLQNFSYGDTPTPEAVRGLVTELLGLGERFDVSRYDLSQRHDIRQLVVSTLLTYLELDGVLAATSPFYAIYKFKPHRSSAEILADQPPEAASFLRSVLACSKKGRIWFTLDIDAAAERVGSHRQAVVEAMEGLSQRGDVDLKVSGLRHGYRRLLDADASAVAAGLSERFAAAEGRDIDRIRRVIDLAGGASCVTSVLLGYFGEQLPGPCGHCDRCAGEEVPVMPAPASVELGPSESAMVAELRAEGHAPLRSSRQLARFLCGLPSPAVGRARLRKHRAFGVWRMVPFDQVLAFVS